MGHSIDDSSVVLLALAAFTVGLSMGVIMAKSSMKKLASRQGGISAPYKEGSHLAKTRSGNVPKGGPVEMPPEVLAFLPGRKIEALKRYREISGLGLKEAKDILDAYCREKGI